MFNRQEIKVIEDRLHLTEIFCQTELAAAAMLAAQNPKPSVPLQGNQQVAPAQTPTPSQQH